MNKKFTIAMAQINPSVGDVAGNLSLILAARQQAAEQGADVVICPEMALCGSPLRDLSIHAGFLKHLRKGVKAITKATADGGPAVLFGCLWSPEAKDKPPRNRAILVDKGVVVGTVSKRKPKSIMCRGVNLGIMVGLDVPAVDAKFKKNEVDILVNLTVQPFVMGGHRYLLEESKERVKEIGIPMIVVNQVGGQDDNICEGASFVVNTDGTLAWWLESWCSDFAVTQWEKKNKIWSCFENGGGSDLSNEEHLYQALMLGLRDYVAKNGFSSVVLGLSGGIDSALVAAIATDALGAERVWGVMMPSPYTRVQSKKDAEAVAKLLGIRLDTLSIKPAMETFQSILSEVIKDKKTDITSENIQSRSRGLLLMALSNKFGAMVLSTGNKSELAVGYATLYGDMCGGYALLKDLYKTEVFALSRWRNKHCPQGALGPEKMVMPERVITKPPSAELRPNQTDQDSLPPYPELDSILRGMIEENCSCEQLIKRGFSPETVERVWQLLSRSEYKRQQGAVGPTVSVAPFSEGFRLPLSKYKGRA